MEHECIDVAAALGEEARQLSQPFLERRGGGVGVDEDERAPGADGDPAKAELAAVEARLAVGARRRPEAAVEPVGPGVVRALERFAAALALDDQRAAVAADVQERVQ